ncbi:hypothetical protein PHYBLDRAFT_171817 [Phycomyces blakesleeanus NRRL 1555(-)]|uniref:Uncharacterized protein n=1 Tax=Phycomyces blakesleeanus (strain ATCC 8743b / DSM 1359 / FGSC 10004 / NBRC 33097 / NRRL 1555) TaxID=763407 RepID=A0A167L856_PHYB8|nr:hypothetical protein PHYBLDRAFT_171817 [Phycomyces blakesleeanus NRRL 1555(-)]OAD69799.1 hypothetical protein PHYBLDRAFT_171817 [Phycomyces blakesleeanus NRRL 1555(-)]|eukprot:XP_018287839.1 hypothetical protein PHYBLDRAFT_171817 [Phycomyces blakesleeanus NRRL 1555(-)]
MFMFEVSYSGKKSMMISVHMNPALRRRNFLALISNCCSICCPSWEWEVIFVLLSALARMRNETSKLVFFLKFYVASELKKDCFQKKKGKENSHRYSAKSGVERVLRYPDCPADFYRPVYSSNVLFKKTLRLVNLDPFPGLPFAEIAFTGPSSVLIFVPK